MIVIVIFGVGENEKDDCLTMTIKVNCRLLAKVIFSCLVRYMSYINTLYVGPLCRYSVLTATVVYLLGHLFVFPTLGFLK